MFGSWAQQFAAWLLHKSSGKAHRRGRSRHLVDGARTGALISRLEVLESRQLLTNIVAVHVHGNSIDLTDASRGRVSGGDDISVSYTGTQVVLTGENGTMIKVGRQTMSTDTVDISSPPSINMRLNPRGNTVSVTGDGTATLSSLNVNLGAGRQNNSLSLTNVIVNSVNVNGGRHDDDVTLNNTTVNGNLNANLGNQSGDKLDLESTTVTGNIRDRVSQLVVNQSTITGKLNDVESNKNSTMVSTDSTYSGAVSIGMGRNGVIDFVGSTAGSNHFSSSVSIDGTRRHDTTVNEAQNSVVFDVAPQTRNVNINTTTSTAAAPTVNSQTVTTTFAPVITGTFDTANTAKLAVTANGQTYTLGTNSQLTTPSTNQWSLNLNGAHLNSATTTVTASAVDKTGNEVSGTGTITEASVIAAQPAIIDSYLTANNLTATTTADGLNYVITTKGTGSVPTAGQSVTVNYSGFLLNTDGTLGTEFDSNTDSSFLHVTPFTFTLGEGQVIRGWDEAFALLPVGTVAQLIIPSPLAYGTTGNPPKIAPNSILVFNVTLVSAT